MAGGASDHDLEFHSQEAGEPTPKFGLAKTAAEAKKIAEDIAGNDLVHLMTF